MTTRQTIAQDALAELTTKIHARADRVLMGKIEDRAAELARLAQPIKEIEFDLREAFQSAQMSRVRALPAELLGIVVRAVFEEMKDKNRTAHIEAFIERAELVDLEGQS